MRDRVFIRRPIIGSGFTVYRVTPGGWSWSDSTHSTLEGALQRAIEILGGAS